MTRSKTNDGDVIRLYLYTFSIMYVLLQWCSGNIHVGAKLKISPILRLSLAHFRILSLADNLKMGWPVPAHLKMGKFTMFINYEELDVTFVLDSFKL